MENTPLRKLVRTPEAAVFDFDLTLADSRKAALACISHALRKLGLGPPDPDRALRTIGLSLERGLEFLTGRTDPHLLELYRAHFVEHADQVMVAETQLYTSVLPALDLLRERGIRLGIASTKYRHRIEAILERHGAIDRFHSIVGGEDVANHKPHPEALLVALDALGVGKEGAVYIGDHAVDAEAASRASVPFVGVLTGTTNEREFRVLPHIAILESLGELPPLLLRVSA
jgi:phosphoglycolate phosphatase